MRRLSAKERFTDPALPENPWEVHGEAGLLQKNRSSNACGAPVTARPNIPLSAPCSMLKDAPWWRASYFSIPSFMKGFRERILLAEAY